jgi:hypothetical protein
MFFLYAGNARAGWIAAAVLSWNVCQGQPGTKIKPRTVGCDLELCNSIPAPPFRVSEHPKQYLRSMFGPQTLGLRGEQRRNTNGVL